MSRGHPVICIPCGRRHGRFDTTAPSVGTFREDTCDWCGTHTSVCSSADYGYPKLPERQTADGLDD